MGIKVAASYRLFTAKSPDQVSNGFVFQGSPIEVTWSKPVDKHSYNARKQITKLLSQGAPATLPIMHQG